MSVDVGPDLPEIRAAAVFGLARSGRAAVTALAERGVAVVGTDAKRRRARRPAERSGVRWELGGHPVSLLDGVDLVVVSPGIPLTLPVFDAARARAMPVVSEIELASRLLPGVVVGITGTNGKSTTTALAAALLKGAGHAAIACGNYGTPWISSRRRRARTATDRSRRRGSSSCRPSSSKASGASRPTWPST
jgi:UDP-N-acetylmuramoylalanine--D-glutamate ligase